MAVDYATHRFLGTARSSKWFVYIVVNLAVFTDAYLYGLIIPVLPFALVERVNLPEDGVQEWIGILLGAYGAGLIVGAPIAGWFADRAVSRRGPYLWGLIALAASTLAFSFGETIWVLLIGRLVQGGSTAIVHTVGMAILADTVGGAGVGPAMGFITMNMALGMALGPLIGGILYHQLGYVAVFVSAYAIVAMDFLLRVLMLENKAEDQERETFLSDDRHYGTSPSNKCSNSSPDSSTPLLSSTTSISSSESPSKRNTHPSSPPSNLNHHHPLLILLTTPRMLAAILGDFTQSLIMTGLESILPLRIKLLFAYNSQLVALVFLPLSLAPLFGPLFGHLSDRIGAKVMVVTGFLTAAPLIILLRLVDHHDDGQVALLCVLLLAIGIALNMIVTPVFSEATYVVADITESQPGMFGAKGAYAQAFGLMNLAYAAGSLVGPLMGGFLVERLGWDGLMAATGVVCAGCSVPCLFATGGRRERGGREAVGDDE